MNINSAFDTNTRLELQSLGLNVGQTTSTNSAFSHTKIGAIDNYYSLGGIDLNNLGYDNSQQITTTNNIVNLGIQNPSISNSSSYPISTSIASNTSTYSNYASPTQSYSYYNSYNMPSVG